MDAERPLTYRFGWLAAIALAYALGGAVPVHADTVVYSSDFESPAGPLWSNQQVSVTPSGRSFLGEFTNEKVVLSLGNIPSHESLILQFNLFVIRSWGGNWDGDAALDAWACDVVGGPSLIHTTFSSTGGSQGYPGEPDEKNSLAYGGWGDSVYRISVQFPHSADAVKLRFAGIGLHGIADESWGVEDVTVSVSDTPVSPRPEMPGIPTQVRAVAGLGSATISWVPPAVSGAGISRYDVIRSPSPRPYRYWLPSTDGELSTIVVDGLLTVGTTYAFKVVAVDTLGNVAISDWSNSILPQWTPTPGVNQLSNSGFESGEMDPWLPHGGASRAIDTNTAYAGAASLYVKPHSVGTWYADSGVYHDLPEFRAGQQYTFSAFMRAEAPRRANMRAYRAGGHWTSRGERHQSVSTEWREYYISFTSETDVVATRLAINAEESTVGLWIDDVRFYEGPYQPTGPEPVLAVVEPAVHYAILDTDSVDVRVGVHNHSDGWNWQLDTPFPTSGPAGGNSVSSGTVANVTGLTPGVAYIFYATLVDASGDILQPAVVASTQLALPGSSPYVLDDEPKVLDSGHLMSWLHLDQPIRTGVDWRTALTRDTIGPETLLLPSTGDAVPMGVDSAPRVWQPINFADMAAMQGTPLRPHYRLDNLAWRHHDLSSDFLVTYLRWDTTGVVDFTFGVDDSGEAYLNGNRTFWSPSGPTATAHVVAGEWNVLVVGIHEHGGAWAISSHVSPLPDAVDNTGQYAHLVDLGTPVELIAPQRVAPGSVFPASVHIASDVSSLDAASFQLSMGPDANIEFDHVEVEDTLFDGASVTVNAIDATQITFVVNQSGGAGVSGPGEIARAYFRAVGPVDSVGSVALASAELSSVQAEGIRAHVASGTAEVSLSCEPGDSNGDQIVNVIDITKIERIVAGLDPAPINACPDANLDGVTNVLDVTSTERIVVGLPAVASAPMAVRAPEAIIRSLRSDDGYAFDLVLERPMDMVDTVYLELLYPKGAYSGVEIDTPSLPTDATLLTTSEPGRTRHVRNVRGLTGAPLSEMVARIRLRETTPGDAPPVTLRVLIGDTSGRALVSRDFHIPMMRVPTATAALPNFPNPFNPETWIPFDLSDSASVTVDIYSPTGQVIRTIDLGRLPAGPYRDRSRAAHWDGRNATGEQVGSGMYFYRLRADDFSSVQRMLILK
jgi:hypothetical protein